MKVCTMGTKNWPKQVKIARQNHEKLPQISKIAKVVKFCQIWPRC